MNENIYFVFQSHKSHLALQGEDRLYVNLGAGITKVYQLPKQNAQVQTKMSITSQLVENKQWLVVLLPSTYSSTNWPIRVIFQKSNRLDFAIFTLS